VEKNSKIKTGEKENTAQKNAAQQDRTQEDTKKETNIVKKQKKKGLKESKKIIKVCLEKNTQKKQKNK